MKYKIFIGYDGREKIAYEVLKHSIEKHSTKSQLEIIPLYHKKLREQGYFNRPWLTNAQDGNFQDLIDGRPFSTEFSHTRFLIPALCNYEGWALFMDCDMLFTDDIRDVFEYTQNKYAVMCVKHEQSCKQTKKMDGALQQKYYRKNWSSFMLINCAHKANKKLTIDKVNTSTGNYLHSFSWLEHDGQIGPLPGTYNWIEDSPVSVNNERPKMIHYTYGGPWFSSYQDVPFADIWYEYYRSFLYEHDLPDPSDKILNVDYTKIGKT